MTNTPAPDPRAGEIDEARSVILADVGGHGYLAATVITPSGDEHLVLAHLESLGTASPGWRTDWREIAPHERTGRLPRAFAPKCGRSSSSGKPCRTVVAQYGLPCALHQQLADSRDRHPAGKARQ